MDSESEVDFSSNGVTPLWRRRSTPPLQLLGRSKPRPQSYQSPSGLLITDFPVEELAALPVPQTPSRVSAAPDGRMVSRSPQLLCPHRRPVTNGRSVSPDYRAASPRLRRPKSPLVLHAASGGSPKPSANGTVASSAALLGASRTPDAPDPEEDRTVVTASKVSSPIANGLVPKNDSPGSASLTGQTARDLEPGSSRLSPAPQHRSSEQKLPLQRLPSQGNELPNPSVVLSTNSPAALKMGKQQIIPKSLASEIKLSKSNSQNVEPHRRLLKVRSMVEGLGAPLGHEGEEGEVDNDLDSPGSLRRGLRSTSYRRAVVSGFDFDSPTSSKKKNRMSQPVLKAVMEDKEKFSSLGRIKKKMLKGQGTFDGEENAVLYQNYKEKALDIDSDEESEPKEQKPEEKIVIHHKPLRSTWSQLSAAIFEVISSEHSYLLSLEILIRMFKDSKELSDTMTKTERHHLFSNITDVCEASKKFFTELEARHQNNILIDDISDIVEKHTASTFDPYVKYCTNEVYQQRTLQKLLATNPSFKEVLSRIESHEDCRNLPMISFLILPMQRVTRLPLLMDTICQKTPKDSPKYEVCKRALKEVSKLVRLCNEGARKMERTEMMYTINSQLEFKIKPFPLVSSSRWLVKRGELTAYVEDTVLFSKRMSRQQVYFFLFNDVLIITKKKSEESYNVNDYSLRDQLLVESCDNEELNSSPGKNTSTMLYSRQSSATHLFTLTVLSNHANEKVDMLLGAETQSERARWITALGHSSGKQPPDRTTLTQVEIIRSFTAKQPDELSLQVADVVLIYQRVGDGWYEGERLRDGERGWFPMECAKEITCQATIDKNVERMGRLLGLETNV
ncbi:SH3 domain-containing guanine exchange factor [Cricetulus griseus]|uniref:SH3 domain-containing guanine exchange factor n=1 Tax=Cricetulus griseus TaxID=10029 RepID=G3HXU6_CRIGR|nr:SH3 domain-containing guanine exchange factor [Cricetulus griseus]ERE87119.1 rho guanine nucleotide exchange factor 26-like protein [Cricetulus griseus]